MRRSGAKMSKGRVAPWLATLVTGVLSLFLPVEMPGEARAFDATATTTSTIQSSVGFVQAWIGDRGPYWFLVDTGANRSALDSAVASSLGLSVASNESVEGSTGNVGTQKTVVALLRVGSLSIRDLAPTVYDLSGSLAPDHEHIAGILGFDALGGHAIFWDLAHRQVSIGSSARSRASLLGASIVPFELDNEIPAVRARIDGLACRLRLDTGASIGDGPLTFVNITQNFYDRLRTRDPATRPITYFGAQGVGGKLKIAVIAAHKVAIGPIQMDRPRLIVQPPVGYFARPDAVGFLGGYSLNHWGGFIVDYRKRQLILLKMPYDLPHHQPR